MNAKKWLYVITAIGSVFLGVYEAYANALPAVKGFDERLAELEQEIRILKRQREVELEIQTKKTGETPIVAAGKDGFSIKSADGNFNLKLRGQIQGDARFLVADDQNSAIDQFVPRRIRPSFEGTVFKYFDFRLMSDFGNGSSSIQDAWVDIKYWPGASLRVGKFKSPIGLERLQSDPVTTFAETALSTNLIPNRDVGIDLHGDFWNGALSYDLGVFNGAVDGGSLDSDIHDDKDFVARLFAHPFRNTRHSALNGLGLGVGASYGEAHGSTSSPQLPTYRSFGQQSVFGYRADGTVAGTTVADGARIRFAPQAYYYVGSLGLLSEFVFSSQEVKRAAVADELTHTAWQLAGSYVLTGENASYSGVTPRYAFDPREGKWGALELAGRFSRLSVDADAFAAFANPLSAIEDANAWTVGLNWYWNKNIKWVLDYEQTFYDGGFATGGDRETENALLGRSQVVF